MAYHPSRLTQATREKIIQAQTPVPASTEHALFTLCETIAREENWYAYLSKQSNDQGAELVLNFLNNTLRPKLRAMLTEMFIQPNAGSVTNPSKENAMEAKYKLLFSLIVIMTILGILIAILPPY